MLWEINWWFSSNFKLIFLTAKLSICWYTQSNLNPNLGSHLWWQLSHLAYYTLVQLKHGKVEHSNNSFHFYFSVPEKPEDQTTLVIQNPANAYLDYNASVLPSPAMRMLEKALLSKSPKQSYQLLPQSRFNSLNNTLATMKKKIISAQMKPTQMA